MDRTVSNFVDDYVEAYNARDVDRIVTLYTEDATIEDPVGSSAKRGHEEIRSFWREAVQFDMSLTKGAPIFICGNEAAISLNVKIGTPDGSQDLGIINIATFTDDGRLTSMRSFYDVDAMAKTLRL